MAAIPHPMTEPAIMHNPMRLLVFTCVLTLAVIHAARAQQPAARQDPAAIYQGIEQFLRAQTAGSPHKFSFTVTPMDTRVMLPACPALEYALPAGARPWGQTAVSVRCAAERAWQVFVTVHVAVTGGYVVLNRAVSQGYTLSAADLSLQQGDLTQLPAGVLTEPEQAAGGIMAVALTAGQPLSRDALRRPLVVQQGQTVVLQSSGRGFRVTAEGRALNNAQDGQVAQARTAAGQTVSGIARAHGIIEVAK
jgi:flagellar basal body P-ring formation protein FlgA